MKDKYRHKIITLPNLLSLFRLLLIPVILWLYVKRQAYGWTTAVLALSGITDIADGIIARRFGMVSDLGKALDPVADKLTQMAVLLCLVTRFPRMLLPLILLVVKETTFGIVGLWMIRKTGQVNSARWHGKAVTVCLYATMLLHLLWGSIPGTLSGVLIGICSALLIFSAVLYADAYRRALHRE